MASARIYRTFGSGNQDKWTFSAWVKRTELGTTQKFFNCKPDGSNYQFLSFNTSDQIYYYNHYSAASHGELQTTRKLTDVGAWYHIVFVYDSGNAASADRTIIYINGVRETAFDSEVQPAQNQNGIINSANVHDVGSNVSAQYFGGCMSHVQFVDGLALAPTEFGQVDATSGIWKIKTGAYGTPGTNGFFLKMEDSSNLDLDSSSNAAAFTTAGTLTATKDNPSNNFATLNPLFNSAGYFSSNTQTLVFANGNTYAGKVTHGLYNTTLAVSSGKFYWEVKIQDTNCMFGVTAIRPNGGVSYGYDDTTCYAYYPYDDRLTFAGASQGTGSGDYDNTSDKIYMFAVDATTNKMWYGRDGTFIGSPSGGTGNTFTLSADHEWSPFFQPLSTAQNNNASFNFGNGYFATTAITSAGTNASNNGLFEYDVPTGFTALCTKGINS